MKVACIQQMARAVWEYDETFDTLVALTNRAADEGAELIVQPEAAYPAYFLGLDSEAMDKALARSEEYLDTMAALAKSRGVHIAAGAAVRVDGRLYNAAVMYDDQGRELGQAYKSNMWHFDAEWFSPGTEYKAFDTKFGRMGMMVCADGRVPEIARILSLDGARVILDLVNLVASAADPKTLMNQQYAFLLSVRAMENGTWLVVANKAGLEGKTASYLGRSMIVSPDGAIVADASSDREEILHYDLDLKAAGGELPERRPELYGELTKETEAVPVTREIAAHTGVASEAETYVTAVQFAAADEAEYLDKAAFYCHAATYLGTRLLLLPPLAFLGDVAAIAEKIRPQLKRGVVAAVAGLLDGILGAVVMDAGQEYGRFHQTHGEGPASDGPIAVIRTPVGVLGGAFGREPYVPELARVSMLLGCDILLWFDSEARPLNTKVMQTRAAENKIFVARTNSRVDGDTASLVSPDGAVLASTFTGVEQGASGMAFLPLARAKNVIPGTNVVTGRLGHTYQALTKP